MGRRRRTPTKASKRSSTEKRSTNWLVVGGIAVIGVALVFSLLFLAFREPDVSTLAEYCDANPERCASLGATDAPVTLVEVSDFGCPHCRDFHLQTAPAIKETYVDNDDVRWIVLPYALRPETMPAANAALCAGEQDRYFEFTEALFNMPTIEEGLTRDGFISAGEAVGLEMDPFVSCLEDGRFNDTISTNQQIARQNRVSATPTFFINDQMLRGAQPLSAFTQQFARYLES